MPTKPATTYSFATDALFGSGPASGFPTKIIPGALSQGFIPGNGINAEWSNYLHNLTGQWITDWISLGSPAAGLNAHLVETDLNGSSAIAALTLGGTVSSTRALTVNSNSGAISSSATIDNASATGFGLVVSNLSSSATVRAFQAGSAAAVQALNVGTGPGGIFTGAGLSSGATFTGGPSGAGLIASGNGPGHGAELRALGSGSALFAERQATGGPAARFEITGAGVIPRGTIFLEPQTAPSTNFDGDVWKVMGVTGFGRGGLEWTDADGGAGGGSAGKQRAWSTRTGIGRGFAASEADTTENAGVNVTKVTLTLGAVASPGQPLGVYDILFKASVRLGAGAPITTRAIIDIFGPGGLIESHVQTFASLGDDNIFMTMIQDTLGVGLQSYSIRFRTNSPVQPVVMSKARIRAIGAFE